MPYIILGTVGSFFYISIRRARLSKDADAEQPVTDEVSSVG
jgi:hypothetical protein